ncbi:MAG: flagellar biosynthetic protein FliR [Desulfatitalea sp.]|nr:flagellar biosynthetic protein FliR [Desulfatitalea sp.]NNK00933.1 flagellar biosynthetic protein FliR [Desulfatitalea sp.]
MLILDLPLDNFQNFIFILVRVGAIVFSVPFLEARNVPMTLKAGLAVAVSIMLLPQLDLPAFSLVAHPFALALGIAGEAAVGLIIGLTVQLLFSAVQLAGQIAGFQMGFAIANVVDPASSLQIPILSQFLNLFALMIFFSINAHYYFIKALVDAFELIPPMGVAFDGRLFDIIVRMGGNMFVVAVKVSAPIIVAMLLTQTALGLTARTVPQMQIFIVAMPLQIILGLTFLGFSLPYIKPFLSDAFKDLGRTIIEMIRLFH